MAVCRVSADLESSDSDYCRQSDGNGDDDWVTSPRAVSAPQPVLCCNINNSFVNAININPKEPSSITCGTETSISPAVKTFMAKFSTPQPKRGGRVKEDSLSDSQSDSNHKSTSKGYHSDGTHISKLPPIGVFWDIENCQVPKGKSAVAVAQAIRNRFFNGYREAEFVIVCDVRKEHSTIIDELNDAQVNLMHVGSTSKNAADEKLRQSMRRFADIHGFPAAIILITGDINFAADINDLRHRKKIRVILLHNDCTSESLLLCASEHYHFYSLLEKLPMRGIIKAGMFPVVISVHNLPLQCDVRRLKTRLKNLTGNCGGRVTHIQPPTAFIKFPSLTHAHRAQKRLEGECVFGNPISVGIPQRTSCSDNLFLNTGNEAGGFMGGYPMAPPQAWLHPTNIFELCGSRTSVNRSTSPWFPCHYNQGSVGDSLNMRNEDYCSPRESNMQIPLRNDDDDGCEPRLEPSISKLMALQGLCSEKNPSQTLIGDRALIRRSLDSYKPTNTNSSLHQQPLNNSKHSNFVRRCRTPSPYTLMSNKQQQPMQPQVQPQKAYSGSGTLQQNSTDCGSLSTGPVELNISNLDYRFDADQLKSTLTEMFTQHIPVNEVAVHRMSDGNMVASVKVRCVEDAQMAISKLHRAKLGHKRIIISYAHTPNPHHPQYLRHQVVSLLREVPGYKLPLFKFVEMFEARYLSCVSVSELHRLKDVVTVVEDSTGRTLSLNQEHRNSPSPTPSLVEAYCSRHHKVKESCGWAELGLNPLPRVSVPIAEFRNNLITLIESHDQVLPLASLHDCYSTEISTLELTEDGVPVEHLVTAVPSVELAVSNTFVKYLRPSSPSQPSPEKERGGINESLAGQLIQLSREVVDLLRTQPQCQLPFHKFIPAYHHHFGRQCRVANYGFTKLIQLLEAIPNTVQVMGEGGKRVVTLSHRAQMRRFMIDTLRVLKAQPLKQAPLFQLSYLFEKIIGKALDPVDYGLCFVSDLIAELPASAVCVTHTPTETILSIPNRNPPQSLHAQRIDHFAKEVIEAEFGETLVPVDESMVCLLESQVRRLLMEAPSGRMRLSQLKQTFNKCFHDKLTPPQIYSLLRDSIKVDRKEGGEEVSLCGVDEEARRLYLLLKEQPGGRLPLHSLEQAYRAQYGHPLPTHGYRSVVALLEAMAHTLILRGKEPRKTVFLNRDLLPKKSSSEDEGSAPGILFHSDHLDRLDCVGGDEEGVMSTPPRWPFPWSNGLSTDDFDNQVPMVNLPEMATPPANIVEGSKGLISPCKNLLPATLHPLLVAPHPSQLPIPDQIYTSEVTNQEEVSTDRKEVVAAPTSTKRKLKLAAHFHNPLDH